MKNKYFRHFKYFSVFTVCLISTVNANTFTVTNTSDSGTGSLRQAIDFANALTSPHIIEFNIPVADAGYNTALGVWEITPAYAYNYIMKDNITIDGTTQTANQGDTNPLGPEIVLNGNNNTVDYAFSVINSSGIIIKGLCIIQFTIGIQIFGNSSINNVISGNYIGITATSADTAGNYIGVELIGGPGNNIVGGTTVAERNIVSGNEHIGIRIVDANNNTVIGNYVGLDRTGTIAMGNYDGISIEGFARYNIVGGTTPEERNVVAGNYAYGIPVFGAGCDSNIIRGNYIGTDITGTYAIPNTYGVLFDDGAAYNLLGGDTPEERNILSGNSGYGVFIYNLGTRYNIVKGNYIGTDVNGTSSVPNANGIVVDGAARNNMIENNLISGNLQQGIVIHITGCDTNIVIKNYIGTDVTGTLPLGNGIDGVRIAEGPRNNIIGGSPANGNIIAFNSANGVSIMNNNDDNNLLSCNSIFQNGGLGIDIYPLGVNANDIGDTDTGPNEGMNFPEIDTVYFVSGPDLTVISGTIDSPNPQTITIEIFKAAPDISGYGEGMQYLSSVTPDIIGNWSDTLTGLVPDDFLTLTATDENNNTSEFSITRNSTMYVSAIDNKILIEGLTVYPNPNTGEFIIEMNITKATDLEIKLIDVIGKVIYTENLSKYVGAYQKTIDVGEYAKGIYNLQLLSNEGLINKKIVVE